ncbi:peptidase family m13 domain-containing protein [Ditylenchus destructor]|uniref:Peptidase family m13 domain-containing protein n=1 Tax=Ditylenchus destructor TaxID=166010 RepID=A0AAD4QUJ4_9BILA|nr:peptidase family m13 domain-containing protein [Ditylenchus destructor]
MARCVSYDLIFSLCFAQLAIYGNYVNAVPLAVGLNFTTTSGARGTILASDATVILEGVVQNFTNTDSASSLFNSVNTFDRIIPIENKVVEDDAGALSYPELSSSINFTLNPCDNFYRFVCQGWYNANVIEDGYTESSHRVVLTQLAFENINGLFQDRSSFQSVAPYDAKLFAFLDACTNMTSRNLSGSSVLLDDLVASKPNGSVDLTPNGIAAWMAKVEPVGLFQSVDIAPDMTNSSRYMLAVQPSKLLLENAAYYLDSNKYGIYIVSLTNYLVSVIKMLVRDDMSANNRFFAKDPTDWARRVQSFITVEFHMAMILNSTVTNFNDPTADFSQTTVGELQRTISPSIDWTYYMMSVLPEEIKGRFNGNIAAIPLLLIKQSALEAFDDLIRTLPDQVLSDYMDWKVILNELSWLDQRFLTATLLHQSIMSGTTIPEEPDFSSACQPLAATTFQRLVDRIYIENFYDNNTVTPQMNEMFQNLKSTFAEMIGNNIWMDPGTKTEALKKLSQMGSEIGYPPSIFNDDQMRSMFDRLNISNEMSFPEMMKKVTTWQVRTQVLLLFDPPATDFKSSEANAFYDPTKNKMLIPAGFLQGAFFNSTWPVQMNYGAIGSIIGHEITHGFDNTGRKFDSQANLRDWWDAWTSIVQWKCVELVVHT